MNICGFNDRVSVDFGITKVYLIYYCVVLFCVAFQTTGELGHHVQRNVAAEHSQDKQCVV